MVEMAHGLPYKEDDQTTAIQFIDAQLEKINSQAVFGLEQDRLEMKRVLHVARAEAGNGKDLDMEILLNQVGGIFKTDSEEEAAGDEESLQAALSAQVRRPTYENRGMAAQDRKGPKKNPDNRSPKQSKSEISKLIQAVFDMEAEMGCMLKALSNAVSLSKGLPLCRSQGSKPPTESRGTSSQELPRRTSQTELLNVRLCRSIRPSYLTPMTKPNPNMEQ